MLSRFFIERPIFATVIAIVIMVAGALAIRTLPIEQYPTIAPPSVGVFTNYPGASAPTVETSVTQVIEQQLTGLDHLLYFSSSSSSDGSSQIQVTFAPGTNADIAQVQVQNKLQSALPLLPAEVTEVGDNVAKAQGDFLMVVALYDTSGRYTSIDIADYLRSYIVDPIARINGVGNVRVFGGQYAIRIWLDPYKLQSYGLMPSDATNAVLAQNIQITAGEVGGLPSPPGQELDATITAQSLMTSPEQFKAIILKTQSNGSVVRLGDVARVELGADDYSTTTRLNGLPAGGVAIQLSPGANALTTADLDQAEVARPRRQPAAGPEAELPGRFHHLHQAVDPAGHRHPRRGHHPGHIAVMFLFLQDWRVTLIPGGGGAGRPPGDLRRAGGVRQLDQHAVTMFAMVLAIGLLVDDAYIVVVENVERIMSEEGLSPKAATIPLDERDHRRSPRGRGAGGGGGVPAEGLHRRLDRRHLPTVLGHDRLGDGALSVGAALILTPALCATLLKPVEAGRRESQRSFFGWFNRSFAAIRCALRRRRWGR